MDYFLYIFSCYFITALGILVLGIYRRLRHRQVVRLVRDINVDQRAVQQ